MTSLLKNKIFIISITLWAIITIIRILNHIPWFDEAHAWTIAEELNIVEIFKLMKVEGHTFLWYLVLMPFAKTNFLYPYSMQFINWFFCLISLIILWKKAPFNNFTKVIITFSFPFLAIYSVIARCYSIGIIFLFLLVVLFKDKLKNPVIYSILLVLCANSNVMSLFGATALGLIFLYDILKSKMSIKNFIIPFSILLTGAVLILLQLHNSDAEAIASYRGIELSSELLTSLLIASLISFVIIAIPTLLYLKKKPKILFFFIFVYSMLTYCFMFMYYGHFWNHSFYFLYYIVTIWLALDQDFENKNNQNIKLRNIVLFLLLLVSFINMFSYYMIKNEILNAVFDSEESIVSKVILYDKNLIGKQIILGNELYLGYVLAPYKKFILKNYCEDRDFDYNTVKYPAENKICFKTEAGKDLYNMVIDIERLTKLAGDESYIFMPKVPGINKDNFVTIKNAKKEQYKINQYSCFNISDKKTSCIYKIKRFN